MRPAALVANLLTLARLLLTPAVASNILRGDLNVALGIFFLAALTDALDGWVARRFEGVSRLGAYLDPVVDKLFLSTAYFCLGWTGVMPGWLVIIVLGRDVAMLVVALTLLLFTGFRQFAPSRWGKLSTFVQVVVAITSMAGRATGPGALELALPPMFIAAAIATLWSGLTYGMRVLRWQAGEGLFGSR